MIAIEGSQFPNETSLFGHLDCYLLPPHPNETKRTLISWCPIYLTYTFTEQRIWSTHGPLSIIRDSSIPFFNPSDNTTHRNHPSDPAQGTVPTPCNFKRSPNASSVPLIFRTLPSWRNGRGGTGGTKFQPWAMDNTQIVLCGFLSSNILNTSWVSWHVFQIKDAVNILNIVRHTLYSILPIGSMGLVLYLPTWMVDLYEKCRQIYRSSHGSYGLYFSMFLLMLPRYNRDKQGSIWLFSNLQKYAKKLSIENKT